MMHNKSIYKKLCTATISLGLLFSIGQFAYAHDPNLKVVETFVGSNPTIENLTLLRTLYKMDIQQHHINGENDEANEAEQKLKKTQAQINSILDPAKHDECKIEAYIYDAEESAKQLASYIKNSKLTDRTVEQYETLAQRWDAVAELAQFHTKYSKKAIEYQIKAAKARASKIDVMELPDRTAEQYEDLAQCWDAVVESAQSRPAYSDRLLGYQIEAARARSVQAQIMVGNNKTPKNYETLAKCFDELSKLYNSDEEYAVAITYKSLAIGAISSIADLTEDFNEKCNTYEKAIKYYNEAVAFAETSGWADYSIVNFKTEAAWSRIDLAKTILERESTLKNYNNWVRCYEELVQLLDKNIDDFNRIDAAEARVHAAIAKAEQANFIVEQHETVDNYDALIQRWNEVVENFEALSTIWTKERRSPEPKENIQGLTNAKSNIELAKEKRTKLIAGEYNIQNRSLCAVSIPRQKIDYSEMQFLM